MRSFLYSTWQDIRALPQGLIKNREALAVMVLDTFAMGYPHYPETRCRRISATGWTYRFRGVLLVSLPRTTAEARPCAQAAS